MSKDNNKRNHSCFIKTKFKLEGSSIPNKILTTKNVIPRAFILRFSIPDGIIIEVIIRIIEAQRKLPIERDILLLQRHF